jgi:hypothetical protein
MDGRKYLSAANVCYLPFTGDGIFVFDEISDDLDGRADRSCSEDWIPFTCMYDYHGEINEEESLSKIQNLSVNPSAVTVIPSGLIVVPPFSLGFCNTDGLEIKKEKTQKSCNQNKPRSNLKPCESMTTPPYKSPPFWAPRNILPTQQEQLLPSRLELHLPNRRSIISALPYSIIRTDANPFQKGLFLLATIQCTVLVHLPCKTRR